MTPASLRRSRDSLPGSARTLPLMVPSTSRPPSKTTSPLTTVPLAIMVVLPAWRSKSTFLFLSFPNIVRYLSCFPVKPPIQLGGLAAFRLGDHLNLLRGESRRNQNFSAYVLKKAEVERQSFALGRIGRNPVEREGFRYPLPRAHQIDHDGTRNGVRVVGHLGHDHLEAEAPGVWHPCQLQPLDAQSPGGALGRHDAFVERHGFFQFGDAVLQLDVLQPDLLAGLAFHFTAVSQYCGFLLQLLQAFLQFGHLGAQIGALV